MDRECRGHDAEDDDAGEDGEDGDPATAAAAAEEGDAIAAEDAIAAMAVDACSQDVVFTDVVVVSVVAVAHGDAPNIAQPPSFLRESLGCCLPLVIENAVFPIGLPGGARIFSMGRS